MGRYLGTLISRLAFGCSVGLGVDPSPRLRSRASTAATTRWLWNSQSHQSPLSPDPTGQFCFLSVESVPGLHSVVRKSFFKKWITRTCAPPSPPMTARRLQQQCAHPSLCMVRSPPPPPADHKPRSVIVYVLLFLVYRHSKEYVYVVPIGTRTSGGRPAARSVLKGGMAGAASPSATAPYIWKRQTEGTAGRTDRIYTAA